MTVPHKRLRDARWRARVWLTVDRYQHELDDGPHLTTAPATATHPRLRVVGTPSPRPFPDSVPEGGVHQVTRQS
ncbi:hypothetical protein BLA60_28795 [Actinophytocola xinjiangensis]|uniref:Uncharacterized protein n=1 Tax=Actinophytocola xinjiangensis TaxID=485602 RepID=A0A7Z1AW39_9PSEU|nr:hypothetical protein [Actinophytocola xinjiangensis]OLF07202.1 hypothetical protein BLA60_28795 [Actinophytocola xinjiangensis]